MKYQILVLFVLVSAAYSLMRVQSVELPSIELPKGAQHNNIGELPFVEVMDDGDYYEEDGAEYTQSDWAKEIERCKEIECINNPQYSSVTSMVVYSGMMVY